ncbi:PAS domain S-box protein [Neobacillus sp. SM06]|uniref:sensor histidine kinase n=1 Tax=Neobacillus sp. SM06 TaxID=3422492 RepID=UPI003D2B0FDE
MSYTKIKYLTILFASSFIIGFEYYRHNFLIYELPMYSDIILSSIIYFSMIFGYTHFVFSIIKKIEKRRQQEEREAKTIFENSIDGIFVFDHHLLLTELNRGAEIMSGYNQSKVTGKLSLDQLISYNDSFLDKSITSTLTSAADTSIKIEEAALKKSDDSFIPVSVTLTRIPAENHEEYKTAVIVRDLSERTQMEDVIKGLYEEATQKQHEAETMYRISQSITSIKDLKSEQMKPILYKVVKDIGNLFDQLEVGLLLYDFVKGSFELASISTNTMRDLMVEEFKLQVESRPYKSQHRYFSFIPLKKDDLILGYLGVYNINRMKISLHQKELMKNIVHNLSILLENIMLSQRMRDIAISEERERLSREMHDGLAQIISSIHVKLTALKENALAVGGSRCFECIQSMSIIDSLVNEAYTEVRQNLFHLRVPILNNVPFVSYLDSYIKNFCERHSFTTKIDIDFSPTKNELIVLEREKVHIIRIIQEAFANIRRHSKATHVEFSLKSDGLSYCFIQIKDNGVGFESTEKKQKEMSLGLKTMKERINLIGGDLKIISAPGAGTEINMTLPLEVEQYG